MPSQVRKKQVLVGIPIVLVIMMIFAPLHKAAAFTVNVDFSDEADSAVVPSALGEPFEISINVNSGELISISSIQLILDNDLSSMKSALFESDGDFASGAGTFVKDNQLTISPSTFSNTGYGYGYGLITEEPSFVPPYSYGFSYSDGHIGGNTYGYSNGTGGTDTVTGVKGPATITITGVIRTAGLALGEHTLDVLIDTGAGGDGVDVITSPPFEFEIESGSVLLVQQNAAVPSGADAVIMQVTDFELNGDPMSVSLDFGTSVGSDGSVTVTVQDTQRFIDALEDEGKDPGDYGLTDGSGGVEVDVNSNNNEFEASGPILDIDISSLDLPDGTPVTVFVSYDESGLSSNDEKKVKLLHLPSGASQWVELENEDSSINGGKEVDTANNLVFATTDEFSFFMPAVGSASSTSSGGGGGGGGGGGFYVPEISADEMGTYEESYFSIPGNQLLRITVLAAAFVSLGTGQETIAAEIGQATIIKSVIKNQQQAPQHYTYIVQIRDSKGVGWYIDYVESDLERGQNEEIGMSWIPAHAGTYTAIIFVCDDIGAPAPSQLSQVAATKIKVT